MKSKNFKRSGLLCLAGGLLSLITAAQAAPFVYANRDLMLCFRKTGVVGSSGPDDVEINIGLASRYYGATPGSTVTVTQFTRTQLTSAFDDLNDMSWSVGGWVPTGTGDATYPDKTLWVTSPRLDPATQASSLNRASATIQGIVGNKINSILFNASLYSSSVSANSTNNTSSVVWVPSGDPRSYSTYMGPNGNYGGSFQRNVENTTPSDFISSGIPARSDLYQLKPGSGPGTYLGYFEVRADGTVVFVAGNPTPPAAPEILSLTRTGTTSTISFMTTNGASYNLRFTNTDGLAMPVSTWPLVPNVATGDGTAKSVNDTSSDSDRFYRIEAH